jgi:thioredoxin reductase
VIWAAGEFQYPRRLPFPGAELGCHTSQIRSWATLDGDRPLVIGGYESGIDAAVGLVALGRSVRVLDPAAPWEERTSDPSVALSPYTKERLRVALATGRLTLTSGAAIASLERTRRGWRAHADDGRSWFSPTPPLLATGFVGSLTLIEDLVEWDGHRLRLTADDESTLTPGLFVCGPMVRHDRAIFCFIYKFRQRFAVVAAAIGARLGLDLAPLAIYRQRGMYLEDLSCCADECAC